ncbi:hypothetical protein EZS27_011002 [termite gut metagenome]|uniref:Tc1-like transposase DDE domain-containing protein n=1 Tax=termite gut metagenome TaxID=433724 RepID=A0A5J4S715_9ZZZZ
MHRWRIKKFKELVSAKSAEFTNKEDPRAIKLFFQDEAGFGRIDNICSCLVPFVPTCLFSGSKPYRKSLASYPGKGEIQEYYFSQSGGGREQVS